MFKTSDHTVPDNEWENNNLMQGIFRKMKINQYGDHLNKKELNEFTQMHPWRFNYKEQVSSTHNTYLLSRYVQYVVN
jgi:hypothetical protein